MRMLCGCTCVFTPATEVSRFTPAEELVGQVLRTVLYAVDGTIGRGRKVGSVDRKVGG